MPMDAIVKEGSTVVSDMTISRLRSVTSAAKRDSEIISPDALLCMANSGSAYRVSNRQKYSASSPFPIAHGGAYSFCRYHTPGAKYW